MTHDLETKFARFDGADLNVIAAEKGCEIEGYASFFGAVDQGGDIVEAGAYSRSLSAMENEGRRVKMLWQHDPVSPIGVWEEVREDKRGLWVKGRILTNVAKGQEAASLVSAGAIDGLSIGYRTLKAAENKKGRRLLKELELWEVSLVTFPMLPSARVGAKSEEGSLTFEDEATLRALAHAFDQARAALAG